MCCSRFQFFFEVYEMIASGDIIYKMGLLKEADAMRPHNRGGFKQLKQFNTYSGLLLKYKDTHTFQAVKNID